MDRPTAQDALTEEELDRLLAQVSTRYPSGRRNLALLLVMADSGLRIGEAVALTTHDLVTEGGQITHLQIRNGKGGKRARQPVTTRCAAKLAVWLESRERLGLGKGHLFCTISEGRSGGHFSDEGQELRPGRPLSPGYANQLVKRLAARAGIERNVSNHTLRHTAITRYLRATGNLELARKYARHAHISTTAMTYAHLVQEDVDEGMRRLPGNEG